MATSKTFSVPKGFKHLIKARGVGYYDYAQLFEGTNEDTSVNIKAQSYDGLSMVQESNDFGSADTVDFANTILPWKWDYYNNLLTSKYCLMPYGETYKVVDTYDGQPKKELDITPISASKVEGTVVYAPFRLEEISRNITFYKDKSFEIKVKIITPEAEYSKYQEFITLSDTNASGDDSGIIFLRKNPNNQFDAGLYTRANSYWNTGRGGSYSSNKECYLRIYYNPSEQKLYFYISYTGDSWTQVYAVSTYNNFLGYGSEKTEVTPLIYFGSWGDGTSEVMQTGAIDFGEAFIYVDGVEVWRGTKNALTTIEGCTHNYNDTGAATTLNCYAVNGNERVVLTPDNDYNGRYLGTVDIAEHTAYDYVDGEWVERLKPTPPITPFSE